MSRQEAQMCEGPRGGFVLLQLGILEPRRLIPESFTMHETMQVRRGH
jgi:hypothetical protein